MLSRLELSVWGRHRQDAIVTISLDQNSDFEPRELCAMLIVAAIHKLFGVIGTQARMRGSSIVALALSAGVALLAAGMATAIADEPPRPAIIVTIPLAAPDGTEQDVATQYDLELIEQRSSQVLARRLVIYRIADDRPQAEVLKQIGADVRVSSAQPNLQYMAPLEQPSDSVVASRPRKEAQPDKIAPRVTAKAAAGKSGPDRRRTSARRLALAPEPKPKPTPRALLREDPATPSPPARISSLGGKLAWPTADEPFVGTPRSNR
jgi:hypothetical protein